MNQHQDTAVAKLASMWAHLDKTTKGATAQKRNPDGSFVSQTSEWSQAWKDKEAALAELALITDTPPPPPPPAAVQPTIGINRFCTGCTQVGQPYDRYSWVLLNEWDAPLIPAIRAKNPDAKCLVYKCMASARDSAAAGVRLNEAPEEWFCHRNGQRITQVGFSSQWQMRVDHLDYIGKWYLNVFSVLVRDKWDGVIIDNANLTCPAGTCDEYPTQASYQAATRTFLADVVRLLDDAGFIAIPNIQHHGSLLTEAVWKDWLSFCSGGALEHYTKWGNGTDLQIGGSGWETSGQAFMRATEAAGKPFLGTFSCPVSDTRSQLYARCSFLMEWDGKTDSALIFEPNPMAADPWAAEEWRQDLGKPTGAKVAMGAAWKREYEGGTVYVNPSSEQVIVGGGMAPMTGLVVK